MNMRTMMRIPMYAALVLWSALGIASAAFGADYSDRAPAHRHIDGRFSHNHVYFDRGYAVRSAPRYGYAIEHGRNRFWYGRGDWYRRDGRGWVVVGAPLGVFVPVLPSFYTTVWFRGVPYYYGNDTYYTWDDAHQEYEVVAPPSGIGAAGTTQAPPSDSIFIYPKNGQSQDQQAHDKYACHRSGVEQTGYDPTRAGGGVQLELAAAKRSDYFRAQAACLEARGYSVK